MRPSKADMIRLLLSVLLAGALGCASKGPSIELPTDPQSAPQASLESLFDQISLQLRSAERGTDRAAELDRQLRTVGGELAQRASASVRTRLSQVGRIDGQLPLGALEREQGALDSIKRWDAGVHGQISDEVQKQIDATRAAIAQRERDLESSSEDEILEQLRILADLSALSGTGSANQARYAEQREEILRDVSKDAEEAIRNEDYEKAQSLLGIVQEVNPGDSDTRKRKCEVDGKVVIKRFSDALETGRVGRSTSMLSQFSETDCFQEVRDGLAESAAPIAEAFGMLAEEAVAAQDLSLAYQRFQDARLIQKLLLERTGNLPGMEGFLAQVDQAYQRAIGAKEFGLAWGYLNVLTEFGPTTPMIRRRLRVVKEEISQRAVRGLTAYPFADSPSSAAKVGDAVASKVVQHLFQQIPNDVRIVEREQLERILEECKRGGNCAELVTADFIVQGSILDAKVETTSESGTETHRVATGNEAVVNPDHVRWSQLDDGDRKRTAEPARTVNRDVTEDVTIEVTSVRKVGIISVSYRVVQANSGRVLFTDSIQTKQEFQDEGRQGVQLGDFKQETDFVELPPDIEILSGHDGLADKIAEAIGGKLVEFLQNPEDQYARDAKLFESEGDFTSAARQAAYAIILRESKSKEIGELRSELKRYAMSSSGV